MERCGWCWNVTSTSPCSYCGREDSMILCGWCGGETRPGLCSLCGRDPSLPWEQRGQTPPVITQAERNRLRLVRASTDLRAEGYEPTIERLAERLQVDPRTVRRWREMSGPRPSDVPPDRVRL